MPTDASHREVVQARHARLSTAGELARGAEGLGGRAREGIQAAAGGGGGGGGQRTHWAARYQVVEGEETGVERGIRDSVHRVPANSIPANEVGVGKGQR